MSTFSFVAESEADTDRLGNKIAEALSPATVVALIGTLGAGKTRLVQAVAEGLGVPADEVTSPTFVLINEYPNGRMPLYHFDTYRLKDDDEFLELGPGEYFDAAGVSFVEWADRVQDCLPRDVLRISIESTGPTSRSFLLEATGPNSAAIIAQLAEAAGG